MDHFIHWYPLILPGPIYMIYIVIMYAIKWPIISPILFGFKYCNARIIQVLNHWFVVYLCFKAVLDTLKIPP